MVIKSSHLLQIDYVTRIWKKKFLGRILLTWTTNYNKNKSYSSTGYISSAFYNIKKSVRSFVCTYYIQCSCLCKTWRNGMLHKTVKVSLVEYFDHRLAFKRCFKITIFFFSDFCTSWITFSSFSQAVRNLLITGTVTLSLYYVLTILTNLHLPL